MTDTLPTPLRVFLKRYDICRQTFYALRDANKAPRHFLIGGKIYISAEAEREWLAAREKEDAWTDERCWTEERRQIEARRRQKAA